MDFNKLVTLLEDDKTWKETYGIKKQLQKEEDIDIDLLITNLDKIINDKKQKPMARLGALRLLKTCLEAGNDIFNIMIANSTLLASLIEYAKIKPNSNIFSNKPDKKETSVSVTFFTYIVEGFLFWSQWFPSSQFKQYFDQLKKAGVKIPDINNVQIFKPELISLYVNAQFQRAPRDDGSKVQQSQTGNKLGSSQQQQIKQSQTPTQGGPGSQQQVPIEEIQNQIAMYDSIVGILIETLREGDMEQDLSMFTEQLNMFAKFVDNLFNKPHHLDDRLQEQLLDKAEQCNDVYSLLEQNQSAQISYKDMKKAVLQIFDKQQNQHQQQDDNQKHLKEQEEYLRHQQESQQKEQAEFERQQLELEQHRREQEELQRKEREDRRKQEEMQIMEEKRKQEEKNQQDELARQKKQKEDEDLARQKKARDEEEAAMQKKAREDEEKRQLQIKRQLELEEQHRQQQQQQQQQQRQREEELAKQKAAEDEKQRKLLEQQYQQQQEEIRRQQEAQKRSQMMQQHNIPEVDEEEEERKSQQMINSRQQPNVQSKQGQSQVYGLYNNPEMMQLKNQGSNPDQAMSRYMGKPQQNPPFQSNQQTSGIKGVGNQNPNPDQLMGFDNDDDFMYDSDIKQKQQSNGPPQNQPFGNNSQQNSQIRQQPGVNQIPQLSGKPQLSNVSQNSQMRNSDMSEQTNHQPYESMGQSKKNPFTNQPSNFPSNQQQQQQQQQSAQNPKNHGNYFGEEEFYEPPAAQPNQSRAFQPIQNQQPKDNQRVDFDVSKNLDDEEEEESKHYQGPASKQPSQVQSGMQQMRQPSQINSRLDQSDNFDNEQGNDRLQIQHINSTIAPKTKPKEDVQRIPANPNMVSPSSTNSVNLPFSKLEQNKTLQAYPFNNRNNIPSGFEQVPFNQGPSLKNQVNQSQDLQQRSQVKEYPDSMNQSKFMQALHTYDEKQVQNTQEDRIPSQQSFNDGRRVPIFSKDKQYSGELNQLRSQIAEMRRERDLEVSKLQSSVTQLSIKNRDIESKLAQKNSEEGQLNRMMGQEKQEMEKRAQEKDKVIFQQKQFIEQQIRDLEQSRSIIRQYEQQKIEQQQILIDKKKAMEDENQKTRQQLQDYINTTQKSHNSHLEAMQKNLNQLEEDAIKYQQDLTQRELENSEIRNELRLLKSKESNFNSNYIREKDNKIQELRQKIEVLTQEMEYKDDKVKDLQQEVLALKKVVDDIKEDFNTTESQIQIYKENIVQKDIEINAVKQTVFEKEQLAYQKEQVIMQLEHTISKKKEIIDQFKGSSESQIKKFHERIEEQEQEIKTLQREKQDLENRIDHIGIQHREDLDRIIQASKLSEEEKKLYKQMMEENERLKGDKQMQTLREQNVTNQISQMQKTITHLKKENEMQEQNMEDLVMANNLVTKKLYERDEQFIKEQEMKDRELELKERKYNTELKYTRQAMDTLKVEKQRRETDLQRNLETLRKENELLLNNLKTKTFLNSERQSRSQIFSPMVKYEPDYADIDRVTNTNSLNERATADRLLYNSDAGLGLANTQYLQNTNTMGQFLSPTRKTYEAYQSPEELQSNNNQYSMNYQNNPQSLNQSTHSLKPKKQYPKNFMGKEISYNPTYFSYLNADKSQMYRFKKSCLKNKMAIYQDSFLNVGLITETKDIEGKTFLMISLFFENKSLNSQMQNVSVTYEGDQSINVYKKPNNIPDVLKENSQHQQQIMTEFNEMPYRVIQCQVKYTINGNLNQAIFPIPNTINKFINPTASVNVEAINSAFQEFAHIMIRSEEINVDKNIASSQYDYTNYFPSFVNLGNVEGLSDYQCIGGQLYLKNIDTNIWLKVNYNKKDHKAIFQLAFDNVIEDYTQNMIKYLLQTFVMIFKE